ELLRNLIVVDDVLRCDFLGPHTPAITLPQKLGYDQEILDIHHFEREKELDISHPILVQLFIRGNPFRGSAGLTENAQIKFKKMLRKSKIQAFVIYGSPYVMHWFSSQLSPEFPWLFSYAQIPIAQAIALETLWGMSRFPDFQREAFI
ncbi:MAG: beta-glucosidase, partial [Chroococcales cyanobacterium]